MPPRIPTRAFTTLPFGPNSVASSSTLPGPPRPSSPEVATRQLHSGATSSPPFHPLERCRRRLSDPRLRQQSRSFHTTSPSKASAKDPYEVLGVKKGDSAADIKKTYYQLAKKWHPDSNKEKGANERFMEIQAAYDILSDDKKRQAYDTYGSASTQEGFDPNFARGAGGFGGFQGFGGGFGGQSQSDLFEQLFGSAFGGGGSNPFSPGGGQRQRPSRGDDLETIITLSFLEACNGVSRKLNITPVVDCKPCTGSGLKPGQKNKECATCRGTGQQMFQVQGMFMGSTCQSCGGAGSTIPRGGQCGECEGVGRVKERKEVEVEIPAGVEDGMKVKVHGMGDMPLGSAGPPGDLLVRVNVKPSAVFRRQGTNLYHDAKVPLHTALLGGRIRIPTLEGDVEVRVREGTQNGEEAVLKGRGVKNIYPQRGRESRGDLVVGWRIQIPRSLTGLQKKIMQAYADDVEGRNPEIHFGPIPTSSSTPSETFESPSSTTPPPQTPPASEPTKDKGKSSSSAPFVETEFRPSPSAEQPSVLENIASAVGGALGWAESLFGGGKKGKGKGQGRLVSSPSTPDTLSDQPQASGPDSSRRNGVDVDQSATSAADTAPPAEAETAETQEVEEEEKKSATG